VTTSAFEHTTNHTVVDRDHNVVVITQTLMLPAGMAVPDTGVVFNNGMSYFSTDPQDINFFEAGERPRFVMSPTIVTRHGQPYFALGSAGGWTIPQMILSRRARAPFPQWCARRRQSAAVRPSAPRRLDSVHDGYGSGIGKGFTDKARTELTANGRRLLDAKEAHGVLNGVMIYPRTNVLSAGADPRREGHAAGW
jgi:gamma-glutamyltranspeptidase/glutathione hydrolase